MYAAIRVCLNKLSEICSSNAFQYTSKGKILLGCRRRNGKLRIEVWDTGSGIPEAELEAIFEEFHRVQVGSPALTPGLGLGLAIVERLGNLLDHRIDVRSRVGKGSVFSVEVSVGRRIGGIRRQFESVAPSAEERRQGTILIVEDDPSVREMLEILLSAEGHRTMSAADAAQALTLIGAESRPDIVLGDYSLPGGMNGLEMIANLRGTYGADIRAVILTGDVSKAAINEIARHGHPRLVKPVNADELLGVIQRLLVGPAIDGRPVTAMLDPLMARPASQSSWSMMTTALVRH